MKDNALKNPLKIQDIEDYKRENENYLSIIKSAKERIRQINLYPDLWPMYSKQHTDDVYSLVTCLQMPRSLELLAAIEAHIAKEGKEDLN